MASPNELRVSKSGQVSVPAGVRRRWGVLDGGRITVIDLGEAAVMLPAGARQKLLKSTLSAEEHLASVRSINDLHLPTS